MTSKKETKLPKTLSNSDIRELSVEERLELVGEIWDSIIEETDPCELSNEQKSELDRRLDAHKDDPKIGSTWNDVKARMKAQRCSS